MKAKSKGWVPFDKKAKNSPSFLPEIQWYVEKELQRKLGLFDIVPLAGHFQNGIAQTKEGKVFINFFPSQNFFFFERSLFTHSVLTKHGIRVPEIVWADTNPHNLQKYNVCCIITRWISGKTLKKSPMKVSQEAFKILGRIHTITLDHQLTTQYHLDKANPLPILSPEAVLKEISDIIGSPLTREVVSLHDVTRVFSVLESKLRDSFSSLAAPVLLHQDFHPGNLMISENKELTVLDLEMAGFGPFFVDLSMSLIKFCYKSRSQSLDDITIEELAHSSQFKLFSQMYFTLAPSKTRKVWEASGSTFLLWAYLHIISRMTKKAALSTHSQEQATAQLAKRWKSVLRYLKRHEKIFISMA